MVNVIPTQFPVYGQDVFNHLAVRFASNHQIQCALTLDAEPVLGCRFNEAASGPHWERLENLDEIELCSLVETPDVDAEVQAFLAAPMDSCQDPQVLVRVIRQDVDHICIMVNHASRDGGAVKEYVELLAHVYTSLSDDSQITVTPNMTGASTYNGVLTLTVGYHQSDMKREIIEGFLDKMIDELKTLEG